METFVGENGQEIVENLVTLEFGDIFHAHDIGLQLRCEPQHVASVFGDAGQVEFGFENPLQPFEHQRMVVSEN